MVGTLAIRLDRRYLLCMELEAEPEDSRRGPHGEGFGASQQEEKEKGEDFRPDTHDARDRGPPAS